MSKYMKFVIWSQILLCSAQTIPKVAVIGAGMGGAFAADHLRMLHGQMVQIDVFEATERAGGRAMSFDVDGVVSLAQDV